MRNTTKNTTKSLKMKTGNEEQLEIISLNLSFLFCFHSPTKCISSASTILTSLNDPIDPDVTTGLYE